MDFDMTKNHAPQKTAHERLATQCPSLDDFAYDERWRPPPRAVHEKSHADKVLEGPRRQHGIFGGNAEKQDTSPPLGTGRCIVLYVDAPNDTGANRKFIRQKAENHAIINRERCFGIKDKNIQKGIATPVKSGFELLKAIDAVGKTVGKLAEIYIFSHGYEGGILGAETQTGITHFPKENHQYGKGEMSVSDIRALSGALTRNLTVILHACSLAKKPRMKYRPVLISTPIRIMASSRRSGLLSGYGCCYGRLICTRLENPDCESDIHPECEFTEFCRLSGMLHFEGRLKGNDGREHPVSGGYKLREKIRITDRQIAVTCRKFRPLTTHAEDGRLQYSYVKSENAEIADLQFDIHADILLSPLPPFAESLYHTLAENHKDATVYAHPRQAKVCQDSDWIKYDKEHVKGETGRLPKILLKACSMDDK